MWAWWGRLVLKLFPVLKLMRDHRATLRQAEADKQTVYAQQHDIARRVHVLEWLTFPRPQPGTPLRREGDRS